MQKGKEALKELSEKEWSNCIWDFETNLKYIQPDENEGCAKFCSYQLCRKKLDKPLKCVNCNSVYCSRDCQVKAWKFSHKDSCNIYIKSNNNSLTSIDYQTIIKRQLRRIRMYLCPYIVSKTSVVGKGFTFVSSKETFKEWISYQRTTQEGVLLSRSFKVEFLTLDELDMLISDNFEFGIMRPSISKLIDSYDPTSSFVFAILFNCGLLLTAQFPLVPDEGICLRLGKMYNFDKLDTPLQLNVDEDD